MEYKFLLIIATILFAMGAISVVVRKNTLIILLGIEMMLNATCLNFITFSRILNQADGMVFSLMIFVVAAVEVAITIAIVLNIFKLNKTLSIEKLNLMKR